MSRLPSVPSALRDLDMRHALPYRHLSERPQCVVASYDREHMWRLVVHEANVTSGVDVDAQPEVPPRILTQPTHQGGTDGITALLIRRTSRIPALIRH